MGRFGEDVGKVRAKNREGRFPWVSQLGLVPWIR